MNTKNLKTIIAIILIALVAIPSVASAERVTRDSTVTPTATEPIRTKRNTSETDSRDDSGSDRVNRSDSRSSSRKLRGAGEWKFIEGSYDWVMAIRENRGSSLDADRVAEALSDPDNIDMHMDGFAYDASFTVDGLEGCFGTEIIHLETGSTIYQIICADGRYTNTVAGTDLDAVIDVADQMYAGDVPSSPSGYVRD